MSKPSSVAHLRPRGFRQVPEDVARKLEEEAEAKGNGIAGMRDRESLSVPVSSNPVDIAASYPSRESLSVPVSSNPAEVPGGFSTVPAEREPSALEAPSSNHTGTGTMRVPRVRKDGVQTRSTSIHLPIILGRQLAIHCAERGYKQNDVIVEALQHYLRNA